MTNNKFDRRPTNDFDEFNARFDKNFRRVGILMGLWTVFCVLLSLSLIAAVVFVVYKILAHTGIL